MKTLSEIDTTSKRATRGAGFPWGIAEEVGKNMRLLEYNYIENSEICCYPSE